LLRSPRRDRALGGFGPGVRFGGMPDVDHDTLLRLLDLQVEDSAILKLEQRKASLPEAARLAEVRDTLAELDADLAIANKKNDEIGREQARLEGEIDLLEQKIGREEQRLFSGAVSNPKELGSLQAEVASLKRKKSSLEDELLEVMEQKEQAAQTLERLQGERDAADAEASELTTTVAGLTNDIDSELATHSSTREELAPTFPSDLIALYDKLRAAKSGVGAAALRGGMCEGCHTKLPQREYERIRAEGGLQRCDNCRRIVVVV
jgi:predicted  nucleic acid-binding Zn-ribbon protein